jgi:hypothetical protein
MEATRDAGVSYTDSFDVTLPTNWEGVKVYHLLLGDDDDHNLWIEIYTKLSTPATLAGAFLTYTSVSLSWSNTESGANVGTEVWRSVNGGAYALDTTVASGVTSVTRSGLA